MNCSADNGRTNSNATHAVPWKTRLSRPNLRTPSDVAEGPWRKSLRGDLDTIVLKALKKTPAGAVPDGPRLG